MTNQSDTISVGQRRGFGWASLALATLVLVPLTIYGLAGETDRWQAALLMEKYLDGDKQQAIDSMREIVDRQPDNRHLRLILARWLLENDKASEALELVEPIFAADQNLRVGNLYLECLQANSKRKEALRLYHELHPATVVRDGERRWEHLNGVAYWQALSDDELDDAFRNSHKVVSEVAAGWRGAVKDELQPVLQIALASVLLYRGSSRVSSGGHEIRTREYKNEIMAILDPIVDNLSTAVATGEAEKSDNLEIANSAFASMLTVRALVWQDLGELDRSFADRRRIAEMGYDAATIASHWPVLIDCYRHLRKLAMYLDTRGFVLYRQGNSILAFGDLNAAIMAQEAICKAGPHVVAWYEFQTADLREHYSGINQIWNRNLAVLLYHRSWIKTEIKRMASLAGSDSAIQSADSLDAAEDLRRVRALGFKPGAGLH